MVIKTLAFLLITTIAFAQAPIGADTLMKSYAIKTRTQLACDANGQNCKPEIISHYDSTGCLILKETFAGDTLAETNRYEYNTARLARAVYTTYGQGNEFLNIKYIYDGQNNLISFQACYPGGKCEPFEKYRYRPDGKLLSRTRYRDGKYFYEYQHKYNRQGNNTEVLILSNDSDSGERELKTYDAKNHHIRSKWIDYRGEEIDNAEYTYDEAGRLIKDKWIGGLSTEKLYEYDALGNNIRYTSIDYNGQVDDLREMTYEGRLITRRVRYDGAKIIHYWKFEYEKW
ncbi:hypothetical protein [Leadbetterella sp. DM7]|uniref:hypothetical protein n=1 Tax=Leadbetterella sp. DM7 TaxID=3235085 RepID=UPI00349EB3E0